MSNRQSRQHASGKPFSYRPENPTVRHLDVWRTVFPGGRRSFACSRPARGRLAGGYRPCSLAGSGHDRDFITLKLLPMTFNRRSPATSLATFCRTACEVAMVNLAVFDTLVLRKSKLCLLSRNNTSLAFSISPLASEAVVGIIPRT